MKTLLAKNVSQLCPAVPFSRTEYYRARKLPGAPLPRADGAHSISEWRKFVRQERPSIKPTEKQELETQLLRKRIRIADLQISDLDNSRTEEIAAQITAECTRIIDVLKSALTRMPTELSPIFSMLGEPMPIFQRFRSELNRRFENAENALQKIKQASRRKDNLVPFKTNGANGANGNGASA